MKYLKKKSYVPLFIHENMYLFFYSPPQEGPGQFTARLKTYNTLKLIKNCLSRIGIV